MQANPFYISSNDNPYSRFGDKELVDMLLNEHNEEALLYLLYDRYYSDFEYYAYRYYDTTEYIDDLLNFLYIQLKGVKGDWKPLKAFQWRSSFRTWISSVASHLFLEKKKELIGFDDKTTSIDSEPGANSPVKQIIDEEKNQKVVLLMEAIARLKDDDYRFILIKEIEGYTPKEIAVLLNQKRSDEKRIKIRTNKITNNKENVIANAPYIYMIKSRALQEVKSIVEQIRKEWYGRK